MGQISSVLRKTVGGFSHWCPGCNEYHHIAVETPLANGARWTFDGDVERPTFSPSVNVSAHDPEDNYTYRCHYFLKAGQLQYLGDCTHAMAGKTVPLPTLPE